MVCVRIHISYTELQCSRCQKHFKKMESFSSQLNRSSIRNILNYFFRDKMNFVLIGCISLFALLGLIEAAGYGYQQSFYHVPVPVLVPPPRRGGMNGGFRKFLLY